MRISKEKLRKIILEEMDSFVGERADSPYADMGGGGGGEYDLSLVGMAVEELHRRMGAVERKIEDMGMGEPGTPFQESKRKSK
jgi:hypothetical protein